MLQHPSRSGATQFPSPTFDSFSVASLSVTGEETEPGDPVTETQGRYRADLMLWSFADGSGALRQRSQLHLGTQPSGPVLLNERQAQSKPAGQSSVRAFLGLGHVAFDI